MVQKTDRPINIKIANIKKIIISLRGNFINS